VNHFCVYSLFSLTFSALYALPSQSVSLTQTSVSPLGPLRRTHSYGRQRGLLGRFQRRLGRPRRSGQHRLAEARTGETDPYLQRPNVLRLYGYFDNEKRFFSCLNLPARAGFPNSSQSFVTFPNDAVPSTPTRRPTHFPISIPTTSSTEISSQRIFSGYQRRSQHWRFRPERTCTQLPADHPLWHPRLPPARDGRRPRARTVALKKNCAVVYMSQSFCVCT
jgi:hypothetical protein